MNNRKRKNSERDHRAFVRYDVRQDGRLLFIDKPCLAECKIKNISADGALLNLLVSVPLPSVVLLWERRTGTIHECEVRWRDGDLVGVQFTDLPGRDQRRAALEGPVGPLEFVPRHRSLLH